MKPPQDAAAERALVGTLMQWPDRTIGDAVEYVATQDLYVPSLQAMFLAATKLFFGGEHVDALTVADECHRQGFPQVTVADVIEVMAEAGSGTSWRRYADIVITHATRRRLIAAASELLAEARDETKAPAEVVQRHLAALGGVSTPLIHREPDDIAIEEFVERPREGVAPWVIHGLIRRRHRIMIVGPEGGGKSWLLRFIAICAAYGVQPFRHNEIPPVKTLIVDLENPEDALYDSFTKILSQARSSSVVTTPVDRLWWRPAGINLRSRADLAELENVIAVRQPDLVCLGPLYNAYEVSASDFGWETAAREVQQAINRLRKRYDFALMIEDHAPQEPSVGKRKMRPYGSSFWLRWPEVGIGLTPAISDPEEFVLERWRGDRVPLDWPTSIRRGNPWPFVGTWQQQNTY